MCGTNGAHTHFFQTERHRPDYDTRTKGYTPESPLSWFTIWNGKVVLSMAGLGLSDVLPIIQSIVLISALGVTLYFSRLQVRAQKANLETAALASLDEKQHHLTEIFMEDPALLKVLVNAPTLKYAREEATAWYTLSIFRYAFHMKERNVLSGDEWEGVLLWMKNAFKHGTLERYWKDMGYEGWFDPSFRNFVNKELLTAPKS